MAKIHHFFNRARGYSNFINNRPAIQLSFLPIADGSNAHFILQAIKVMVPHICHAVLIVGLSIIGDT